mmetsp:Transcript_20066/g.70950  ORF Transcript_20066/g.70950 Transcript_20066/m.70950 type:complete len:981 (-) Transcript_20066:1607-4549(-)
MRRADHGRLRPRGAVADVVAEDEDALDAARADGREPVAAVRDGDAAVLAKVVLRSHGRPVRVRRRRQRRVQRPRAGRAGRAREEGHLDGAGGGHGGDAVVERDAAAEPRLRRGCDGQHALARPDAGRAGEGVDVAGVVVAVDRLVRRTDDEDAAVHGDDGAEGAALDDVRGGLRAEDLLVVAARADAAVAVVEDRNRRPVVAAQDRLVAGRPDADVHHLVRRLEDAVVDDDERLRVRRRRGGRAVDDHLLVVRREVRHAVDIVRALGPRVAIRGQPQAVVGPARLLVPAVGAADGVVAVVARAVAVRRHEAVLAPVVTVRRRVLEQLLVVAERVQLRRGGHAALGVAAQDVEGGVADILVELVRELLEAHVEDGDVEEVRRAGVRTRHERVAVGRADDDGGLAEAERRAEQVGGLVAMRRQHALLLPDRPEAAALRSRRARVQVHLSRDLGRRLVDVLDVHARAVARQLLAKGGEQRVVRLLLAVADRRRLQERHEPAVAELRRRVVPAHAHVARVELRAQDAPHLGGRRVRLDGVRHDQLAVQAAAPAQPESVADNVARRVVGARADELHLVPRAQRGAVVERQRADGDAVLVDLHRDAGALQVLGRRRPQRLAELELVDGVGAVVDIGEAADDAVVVRGARRADDDDVVVDGDVGAERGNRQRRARGRVEHLIQHEVHGGVRRLVLVDVHAALTAVVARSGDDRRVVEQRHGVAKAVALVAHLRRDALREGPIGPRPQVQQHAAACHGRRVRVDAGVEVVGRADEGLVAANGDVEADLVARAALRRHVHQLRLLLPQLAHGVVHEHVRGADLGVGRVGAVRLASALHEVVLDCERRGAAAVREPARVHLQRLQVAVLREDEGDDRGVARAVADGVRRRPARVDRDVLDGVQRLQRRLQLRRRRVVLNRRRLVRAPRERERAIVGRADQPLLLEHAGIHRTRRTDDHACAVHAEREAEVVAGAGVCGAQLLVLRPRLRI